MSVDTGAQGTSLRVFLSWSGARSKGLAQALRDWLPRLVQGCDPWLSEDEIDVGKKWREHLDKILEETDCGIVCLTRSNLLAPWLMLEAGALSKQAKARVIPLLLDGPLPENHPLKAFQAVRAEEAGIRKLVGALWDQCGGWRNRHGLRVELFDKEWPALGGALEKIRAVPEQVSSWQATVHEPSKEHVAELVELRGEIQDKAASALQRALEQERQKPGEMADDGKSREALSPDPSADDAEGPKVVRVNVYFLDLKQARDGILELRMHEKLSPEKERNVWFRQEDGLTGHAFQSRCPFAAWGPTPPGGEGWKLTDFKKGYAAEAQKTALSIGHAREQLLDSRMRWIISLPLQKQKAEWPLAVINIDGFAELPPGKAKTESILKAIIGAVESSVEKFADVLTRAAGHQVRLIVD